LISAGQIFNLLIGRRCFDRQFFNKFLGNFLRFIIADRFTESALCLQSNNDIFTDSQITDNALFFTIFRTKSYIMADCIQWICNMNLFFLNECFPGCHFIRTEKQPGYFTPAGTQQS
jgi:hypothetical protein